MSIPPESPWRGCAAFLPQPVNATGEHEAQFMVETIYYFNCRLASPRLADIEYRNSNRDEDIIRHVFRWDSTPYQEAFEHGFRPRRQEGTPDEVYWDLERYVNHGGRPLDSRRPTTHAFISTTLSSSWHPSLSEGEPEIVAYRYEIYAPGGIWVSETLGNRYQYPGQDEVCFAGGIAPQYIRSAQAFRLKLEGRFTRRTRVDDRLNVNGGFNPDLQRLLHIQRPIFDYQSEKGERRPLKLVIYRPQVPPREKREVNTTIDWYTREVADVESYINAAFRSSVHNEAYVFMMNDYVAVNYAPGTTEDVLVVGLSRICEGYPSLAGTAFGEYGINCAFGSDKNEAFIFSGNLCAHIDYAPHSRDDKILKGPMTIVAMFPFFRGTVFESSVDAAFESTVRGEAYLFKGNQYARITYGSDARLFFIHPITKGFPILENTIFESGLDAAFASHVSNEAYLFKGDSYARIHFTPGATDDYLIGGVHKILPFWPSLRSVLPHKNRGLDVHEHNIPDADRDHDEL